MNEAVTAGRSRAWMIGGAVLAIAALIAIYLISGEGSKPPNEAAAPAARMSRDLATGSLAAFVIKSDRKPVPDISFANDKDEPLQLSQWRGRVALVNLWATWCAPCRKEMPALAALQQKLGSRDFEVVAISVDRKGIEASGAFLKENNATALKLYVDKTTESLDKLQAIGLPATVLIDRQGNEIGRMLGPAEWSSPEAVKLVEAAIAEK